MHRQRGVGHWALCRYRYGKILHRHTEVNDVEFKVSVLFHGEGITIERHILRLISGLNRFP